MDDAKIFAAIPSEVHILTWKKWSRPVDWRELRGIIERGATLLDDLSMLWRHVSTGYEKIAKIPVPENLSRTTMSKNEAEGRELRTRQAAETKLLSMTCFEEAKRTRSFLTAIAEDKLQDLDTDPSRPAFAEHEGSVAVECTSEVRKFMVRVSGGVSTGSVDNLVAMAKKHCQHYQRLITDKDPVFVSNLKELGKQERKFIVESVSTLWEAYEVLLQLFNRILDKHGEAASMVREMDDFHSFKIPADIECPTGVPFAAYTVELDAPHEHHHVVNVVEGCAWVDDREATETMRAVTELVSQMLVERAHNPKAPTRVIVREVDPKHAHEARSAEARPGPPKVRTIKLFVAPPRYLREAAEVIFSSPRRAHWVVGHWRNQPFGPGREKHKQAWIKPHVRGLGEAGATMARVSAAPAHKEHV